ncbi:hypothetical protein HYDPIDRAFT_34455 [Hydnomerulius pinastri MD-312]|uniref:Uncharacterized protein n=1 Tax=Hydnomerulius pinastri MD-312 TaxID=994086 RepID=A0A0C9VXD1_9AGAM|nr:hypothetical protein HYDPIDRAFT_34634 [Hydnomerulius pinastri MD-312]KIJ58148.1 hypothetical protein HYDPIDRAFT_34455 [Hydnomerulius pinastri MD-312]
MPWEHSQSRVMYEFTVSVQSDRIKCEFQIKTDTTYEKFCEQVCAYLTTTPAKARLGYKLATKKKSEPPALLVCKDDWKLAIDKISGIASRARSCAVVVNVFDTLSDSPMKKKKRSRCAADHDSDDENLVKAYQDLERQWACEKYKGHCFVLSTGSHKRMDYQEMSLWAKKLTMNPPEATLTTPPHCLTFENSHNKPRNTTGSNHTPTPEQPMQPPLTNSHSNLNHLHHGLSVASCDMRTYPHLDYPSLAELLSGLDGGRSEGFFDYYATLEKAGIHHVDDISTYSEQALYLATGLPAADIRAIYQRATELIKLVHKEKSLKVKEYNEILTEAYEFAAKAKATTVSTFESDDSSGETSDTINTNDDNSEDEVDELDDE